MFYKADIQHLLFRNLFSVTLLFSILIHIAVLFLVEWRADNLIAKEEIIEVNLLRIRQQKVAPRAVSSKLDPLPQKKNEAAAKKKPLLIPGDKVDAVPPKPVLSIKSNLDNNDFRKGRASAVFEEKGLETPGIKRPKSSKITLERDDLKFSPNTPPKEGKLLSFGKVEEDMNFNRVGAGDLKKDIKFKIGNRDKPTDSSRTSPRKLNFSPKNYIEGEVRRRKIVYKPKPPRLNIERNVTVVLKFTVLPNGEVDRIFPHLKADPKLERIATTLLRQYRFEPLFGDDDIQEGIIYFTINRND